MSVDRSVTQSVTVGFFWPLVFLCLFLTGNCSMCGGDTNYVDAYIKAVDKAN